VLSCSGYRAESEIANERILAFHLPNDGKRKKPSFRGSQWFLVDSDSFMAPMRRRAYSKFGKLVPTK
jgi:hypothetical protein